MTRDDEKTESAYRWLALELVNSLPHDEEEAAHVLRLALDIVTKVFGTGEALERPRVPCGQPGLRPVD
jgi:hypothetical protein